MKLSLLLTLLLGVCVAADAQNSTQDLSSLSWLEGLWKRTNSKSGKVHFEKWERIDDQLWKGQSYLVNGSDTTISEKLSLIISEGKVYYVADVPENSRPVRFLLTMLEPGHFIAENQGHDFPKKIEYRHDHGVLTAQVSGDGTTLHFRFQKQ